MKRLVQVSILSLCIQYGFAASKKDKAALQTAQLQTELALKDKNELIKENAALKHAADEQLAKQKALMNAVLPFKKEQAYTISNLTTVVPTNNTLNKEKAIAKLVTDRHEADSLVIDKILENSTISASNSAEAVALGNVNKNILKVHTEGIEDLRKSQARSDRLEVIIGCFILFTLGLISLLFKRTNQVRQIQ